jgi:hypothetical protein
MPNAGSLLFLFCGTDLNRCFNLFDVGVKTVETNLLLLAEFPVKYAQHRKIDFLVAPVQNGVSRSNFKNRSANSSGNGQRSETSLAHFNGAEFSERSDIPGLKRVIA